MATRLFERRNFLIRPRFQLLLASKAVVFLLLYSAAITYISLYSVAESIYILPFNCLTPEVKARLWHFPTEALWVSLLIALVVVLWAIVTSRRVAGPEFRLTRTVRGMAAGQYPHAVTLRKHDHLKELAASVSFLGQELDQRRQVCLEQLVQVDAALDACTMDSRHNVPADVVQAQLEGLRKQICGLKEFVAQGTEPRREEQIPPDLRLDDRFQDRAARSQQW
jgi:HAMP domain-containing protein